MNNIHILLIMIFLHIFDDYKQGILASMKQKQWWREQKEYTDLYKYDYIAALLCHSFSWTFMIMLPILVLVNFKVNLLVLGLFLSNFALHAFIDDLKANRFVINLVTDQSLHILQIVLTWILAGGVL